MCNQNSGNGVRCESPLLGQTLGKQKQKDGKAYMLIYFRFVVDACSELNLRQANCLTSIFYLKFRFYTQKFVFL